MINILMKQSLKACAYEVTSSLDIYIRLIIR